MKHSIKRLFILSAIMMSFILAQGVWAQADIITLEGTATTVENRAIGLDTNDDGETDITVYHMGPSWYWDMNGMSYPKTGDYLVIEAYDGVNGYVGVSVYLDEINSIYLRDTDTLKPLWPKIAEKTGLSNDAAEANGNSDPIKHDYNYDYDYNYNYDYNYDHSYESQGPHGK